jgi:hypothetical protein
MYRRKSRPDLLFTLTVFVCLSVLLTTTVNAAEKGHWGINLSAESGCGEAIGEWQGCLQQWASTKVDEPAPYRAAVRLSSEERPGLGVVWYYTRAKAFSGADRDYGLTGAHLLESAPEERRQFGVVVKQQYRHFGLSLGIEAERPESLTDEPLLYFGLSNRW